MNLVFLDNQNPEIFQTPTFPMRMGWLPLARTCRTTRLVALPAGNLSLDENGRTSISWCWYSPNPRMMLYPKEFKISRSLARALKDKRFEVRIDHNFAGVMRACASIKDPVNREADRTRNGARIWNSSHQGIAHSIDIFRRQTKVDFMGSVWARLLESPCFIK